MSRAVSLNWEIDKGGERFKPQMISEHGSEESTLEVVDGEDGYEIGTGIIKHGALDVEFNVNKTQNRAIDVFEQWADNKSVDDIFLIGKDSARNTVLKYSYEDTECKRMKDNASDRSSKEVTKKRYKLLPRKITKAS